MSTNEYKGVVDPNTWKNPQPFRKSRQDSRTQWEAQKNVAKQLRYFGMEGHTKPDGSLKQPGYRIVARFLADHFPAETPENAKLGYKLADENTVDQWLRGMPFAPDQPAYKTEDLPRQWRSYVARLSLISQFWHERPLTGHEAKVAEYVGNEFQDRLGGQVDLIPQLAIVREIASLEAMKKNSRLKAFETYFTFAPWKIGTDLYVRNLPRSEWRIENGFPFPFLTDFLLLASESQGYKLVSPLFEEALVQLGLSYRYLYFDLDLDAPQVSHNAFYGDSAKGQCNWVSILETRGSAYDKELQLLEQQLKQSTEQGTNVTDEEVSEVEQLRYRVANKKDEWKQIERVPYEEANND
jgi:hypothetical protein